MSQPTLNVSTASPEPVALIDDPAVCRRRPALRRLQVEGASLLLIAHCGSGAPGARKKVSRAQSPTGRLSFRASARRSTGAAGARREARSEQGNRWSTGTGRAPRQPSRRWTALVCSHAPSARPSMWSAPTAGEVPRLVEAGENRVSGPKPSGISTERDEPQLAKVDVATRGTPLDARARTSPGGGCGRASRSQMIVVGDRGVDRRQARPSGRCRTTVSRQCALRRGACVAGLDPPGGASAEDAMRRALWKGLRS